MKGGREGGWSKRSTRVQEHRIRLAVILELLEARARGHGRPLALEPCTAQRTCYAQHKTHTAQHTYNTDLSDLC